MNHFEQLLKIMEKRVFDVRDVKLAPIFIEFFCVEDNDLVRKEMSEAISTVGEYVINKLDQVLYDSLGLKGDKIDKREIMGKIETAVALSKSIKSLIGYERLVQEVIEDPNYNWRLIVLDGARYINKTGNSNLELLYPSLGNGKFQRHLYKDIVILAKQRKHIYKDEDPHRLDVILNYLYVLRIALSQTLKKYNNTVNITDAFLKLICKERYGLNWFKKWHELSFEFKLRDLDV